jgi:peptide/nickel transport system substrate-binding protein
MKQFYKLLFLFLISLFFLQSCSNRKGEQNNRIVVAIKADAESLNPLFAFSFQEVNITELLYLSLVQYEWNDSSGNISPEPMAAKSWTWNEDSTSVTIVLRDDINWSDGVKLTAEDVIFSFDAYSDPDIQSRLFGTFNHFILEKSQHIDLAKSFTSANPYELKINFRPDSHPELFDIDIPIIPKHIFSKLERKNFVTLEKGKDSVTCGAFCLYKWNHGESVILRANEKSFLHKPGTVKELIFKVIPDYNSRITQLKNGEIDLMDNVKPDQLAELKAAGKFIIAPVKGREYDYAGWNNVDPESFINKKIKPNDLFGTAEVRKALTYAINREEILSEFLGNNGDIAVGPVAHIFKEAYNYDLKPIEYSLEKAKQILASSGWKENNNDGILEKSGKKFSFTLNYPGGNPLREYAATIIKHDFKSIGIDVTTEPLEPGVYFEKMLSHKLNAWLGGWSVPVPLVLKPYWYSDPSNGQLNVVGYNNPEADKLLDEIEKTKYPADKNRFYLKLQEILYNDNPVSFLYWIDDITAYNNRMKNILITPLGSVHHCWNWEVNK